MSNLYVACELGPDRGRVFLGALQKEGLTISEAAEFKDLVTVKDGTAEWDVARIYQQVLTAVRGIAAQEVPIRGISFHTSAPDCLLFEDNGSLLPPATRVSESSVKGEMDKVLAKVPLESFYGETGTYPSPTSALFQLAAESGRRLKKAGHALSLADGFNYLFSGVPCAEISQATRTQFYNPTTKSWSGMLLKAGQVPERLAPPLVPSSSILGPVRPEVADGSGLEDARSIATSSNQLAAALAALHIADTENWAFLWPDKISVLGALLDTPFINDLSREMKYSNLVGFDGWAGFYREWVGLGLIDRCHSAWSQQDRALDNDVLLHLATSATPFEALIDPCDARFSTAEDVPQAIQAFCRETGQEAPRKPGPVLRCVLESLALQYRKGLVELEYLTSAKISRLYVLGGKSNVLLNHFLANALQIPVVVVPTNVSGVGNVALQALALGHLPSLEHARSPVTGCLRLHTINPHATAWTEAYDRFLSISPS